MQDSAQQSPSVANREMVASRLIDAPAALVYNAWIEPKQLEKWWGPTGLVTTVHEMEVEQDGITRLVMVGPDGTEFHNKFVYSEIKAAKQLSYMQSDDSDPDTDASQVGVTVLFSEEAQQTRVTMHTLFKSTAERDRVVQEYDASNGALQTLERLERFMKDFLPPR